MPAVEFVEYDEHPVEVLLEFDAGLPEMDYPVWHLHWISSVLYANWRDVPPGRLDGLIQTGCERFLWFAIGAATFDLGVSKWRPEFYQRRFAAYVSWLPELCELQDKLCRQSPESVIPEFIGPPEPTPLLWGCIRVVAERAFVGLKKIETADLSFDRLVSGLCDEGVLRDEGLSFSVRRPDE